MTRLISGLILLAVFSFSTSFYQQFYIPKLIVFYGSATACIIFIGTRHQLFLPNVNVLLFIVSFLAVGATLGICSSAPLTAFMQWSYYFAAFLLFIVFMNLKRSDMETLLKTVFAAALLQLILVIPQFLSLHGAMPAALIGQHERIFGTVGNQEFLSTLLGVGFFLGLHFHSQTKVLRNRALLIVGNAALLIGLVLAQNKGALMFIGLYFLWRHFPNYKLMLGLCGLALVVAVLVFPTSINGRLFLWLVAATMFAQHFALGVGFLQFENHYLDVAHKLFNIYPALSDEFGSYTAMMIDAHNIFLQFGTELGIAGLLLSLVLVGQALRLANANRNYLGLALLFLLFKSLYTVMLSSITGMIVFVLLLAILSQKRGFELSGNTRRVIIICVPTSALMFIAAIALSSSDYFYQQAARSLFMGQSDQAVKGFNRALSINKENADAYLGLAQASYINGAYDDMRGYIDKALLYKKTKDTYKIAAYMLYYAKRYDNAYELFQFLHMTFPQHLTSMTKLASIYMLRGKYDEAYTMAQAALRSVPRKPAESDARNIKIASQIVADCYPFISPSVKSSLGRNQ